MTVLVAQLGTPQRWSQFSPHFDTVQHFFGAQPDERLEIQMRAVSPQGTLQGWENRTSIPKDSKNWSFEIGAATGLQYPPNGDRPVVVFLRRNDGTFVYHLLMPGDPQYTAISQYVTAQFQGPARELAQVIVTVQDLQGVWPNCPLLNHGP